MDLERQRARLQEERERLERMRAQQESELVESEQTKTGELSSYDQHPADTATYTTEREQALSVAESFEEQIRTVDDALARIDQGTYGRCAECGTEIGEERLAARPEAPFCMRHQQAVERARSA